MRDNSKLYKKELLENVIPFWMEYSKDTEYGGYFSCLDRFGKIYDTDKFIWLQAREVWTFANLCQQVEVREEWLNMAKHGADFLMKYGRDKSGDFYFSLNREGKPLVQPYNIFADCFAAMAFASLSRLLPNENYGQVAVDTFQRILRRRDNPKGKYAKAVPGTRDLKDFSLPMILSNLTLELEPLLDEKLVEELVPQVSKEVMDNFYCSDEGLILEHINKDGSFSDCFEGRLINPGHAIEAMWFMLDLAERYDDHKMATKAIEIGLNTLNYGWDKTYGGIYYFMDIKGHPSEKLEWDQKLWWVHLEALVFLSKAMKFSHDPQLKEWFEKVHNYTWRNFKDVESPEWFGYLNRKGEVLLDLKGGKWKGCFHVPRSLLQIWKTLEDIENAGINSALEHQIKFD